MHFTISIWDQVINCCNLNWKWGYSFILQMLRWYFLIGHLDHDILCVVFGHHLVQFKFDTSLLCLRQFLKQSVLIEYTIWINKVKENFTLNVGIHNSDSKNSVSMQQKGAANHTRFARSADLIFVFQIFSTGFFVFVFFFKKIVCSTVSVHQFAFQFRSNQLNLSYHITLNERHAWTVCEYKLSAIFFAELW